LTDERNIKILNFLSKWQFLRTAGFKTVVIFYTAYFVLISIAFRLLWYAASRKPGVLMNEVTAVQIKQTTRNENTGLMCNTIIFVVAFFNPWLALALSFAMWVYWLVFA
jgi:hypothetical protein